ncbi:MAG: hypothetical protein F6K30_31255, partial [Cyanothece sp. SIO2G6]|nr:hypothetical protein [Cyanothece sp. SIO2G6]
IEFIQDLGNLAVYNIDRQPDSVEQIQAILENISQTDPDLAVQEEADAQIRRIFALN